VPARDGDEGDRLGVETDLLDEARHFLDDFVEALFGPLGGIHLVNGDDQLTDTEGESQQSVFTGLTILGDTSLDK
jgi:hypothetical protein